jgi:putative transposase
MDNGPGLISEALMSWCGERDITMHHIEPGKPDQNA